VRRAGPVRHAVRPQLRGGFVAHSFPPNERAHARDAQETNVHLYLWFENPCAWPGSFLILSEKQASE
jgi:hypothetical protein